MFISFPDYSICARGKCESDILIKMWLYTTIQYTCTVRFTRNEYMLTMGPPTADVENMEWGIIV